MKSTRFFLTVAVLLFVITIASAQQNSIVFSYDKAGNTTERKLQATFGARMGHFTSPQDSVAAQKAELKIYPNPTSQFLTIEGALPGNYKDATLTLINTAGLSLKTESYDGQLKTLDLSALKEGLYILRVQYSKKDMSTYKIIITN